MMETIIKRGSGGVLLVACGLLASNHLILAQPTGSANREAVPSAAAATQPVRPFVPISESERFHRYLKDTFSPTSLVSAAASAGIQQARNRPEPWGQGAEGYGRRIASSYGEHIVRQTLMFGLSSALHEDNRYFASGESGAGSRIEYAVESTFLARHDDGSRHVSISKLAGFAGAALISRSWQPNDSNKLRNAGINLGTSFSVAVGFNVAREFIPRLFR